MSLKRPKRCSSSELARAGVALNYHSGLELRCMACGTLWSPQLPPRGRKLTPGYWKCPNGCNANAA
jgi:hypothetical protein